MTRRKTPEPEKPTTIERRALLAGGASLGLGALACQSGPPPAAAGTARGPQAGGPIAAGGAPLAEAPARVVLQQLRLGPPPWETFDPFLFCVHHRDDYPAGNAELGPVASLAGRNIGQDFANKDGWNMYHGDVVPGFPRHPHRGFETVTVTRRGFIDHSDSLGATARYGEGDVQWMTAGSGIVHAEMFPLLDEQRQNPAELFQIWLNLPARNKFARPYFSMFWKNQVPHVARSDERGLTTHVTVVAGALDGATPPAPPPDSWAAQANADVAIWSLVMDPGARFELPRTAPGVDRTLYVFEGDGVRVGEASVRPVTAARLAQAVPVAIENGGSKSELLLLQGRPIGEPVVKYGPFVMNQRAEIEQAIRDYRATEFGGWPWRGEGPVHARDSGRFAIHADGRKERAT
ncbi:MAG TPA: pirin family protein [Polyangiaceae bacterium]|nr:pirin family protein [Polyangiaceae bacterium]